MSTFLETTFAPAEATALADRDLSQSVCVVFDILRATTTMMMALANGAEAIYPVREIPDAVSLRQRDPSILLAGERDGVRIRAALSGAMDFDLGNSPREFTPGRVGGRKIAITTTNGTRALQACRHAKKVVLGSFLNLATLTSWLRQQRCPHLLLVCSGTMDQVSFEDVLGAGAVASAVWDLYQDGKVSDASQIARLLYQAHSHKLVDAMQFARNGRRLLNMTDLREDVEVCLTTNQLDFIAEMTPDGVVRRLG